MRNVFLFVFLFLFCVNLSLFAVNNDKFKDDARRKIIQTLLEKDGLIYENIEDEYKDDVNLALIALKQNIFAYNHFTQEIRENEKIIFCFSQQMLKIMHMLIIFKAESISDNYLLTIPKFLREDKEIVIEILKKNSNNFKYLSDELKKDKDILEVIKY